jgi:hypothetical protein
MAVTIGEVAIGKECEGLACIALSRPRVVAAPLLLEKAVSTTDDVRLSVHCE